MSIKLPYNSVQKFQIGDICRVSCADNTLCCPLDKDEDATGCGCEIIIVGSYGQIFPNISTYCGDYEVFIPRKLNPSQYDKNGDYNNKGCWCRGEYGWAWVSNSQLDFVRKPDDNEKQMLMDYMSRCHWRQYKEDNPSAWIWDSYNDMLNHWSQNECQDGNPACYNAEKDNPYPLYIGNGDERCKTCALWKNLGYYKYS